MVLLAGSRDPGSADRSAVLAERVAAVEESELLFTGYVFPGGPAVVPDVVTEQSILAGPVLISNPGSVGAQRAIIFGRRDDLRAVPTKVGETFVLVRSGDDARIEVTVEDVSTVDAGSVLPGDEDVANVFVSWCVDGCRSLEVVRGVVEARPEHQATAVGAEVSNVMPAPPVSGSALPGVLRFPLVGVAAVLFAGGWYRFARGALVWLPAPVALACGTGLGIGVVTAVSGSWAI